MKTPQQFQLDPANFPKERWWLNLVSRINQFVLEVVQAIQSVPQPAYKVLSFTTGTTSSEAFPIDFPVEVSPADVHVAQVVTGVELVSEPVTVSWTLVSTARMVRVRHITGLSPNTTYSIRLALQ